MVSDGSYLNLQVSDTQDKGCSLENGGPIGTISKKNRYRSCKWSLNVAMYGTLFEASLQARASLWAAQATAKSLGKLSLSCFATPFKRPRFKKFKKC